jgi:hypothetical protein
LGFDLYKGFRMWIRQRKKNYNIILSTGQKNGDTFPADFADFFADLSRFSKLYFKNLRKSAEKIGGICGNSISTFLSCTNKSHNQLIIN